MNLLALIAIPLATALAVGLIGESRRNVRELATMIGGLTLAIVVACQIAPVMAGERPEQMLWAMMPGIEFGLRLEPLGLLFACVAAGLWPLTSLYGVGYMRGHDELHQTRFFVCFAIAIAAAMGIALASNLVTLFVFYEVLTLSTWPLVTHAGTPEAKRGGRIYLGVLLTTSIGLLLPAIVWTASLAGTTDFTPGGILSGKASPAMLGVLYALFLFGIGKAALMPFHRWLPAAMVAPTPVSALLHAVAVVKAGVFTVLKVTVLIFGLDTIRDSGAGDAMVLVAAFTLVMASLVALSKDNLKARLAYSTISQLAYIVLGSALATELAATGAGLHIVMHALGKITLFFCAGAIIVFAHKTKVSELDGLGRAMPVTFAAFLLGSLSIIGLPPLGGAWSKWWLLMGAMDADQAWLIAVLSISSLLNIAYLMPVVIRGFFGTPEGGEIHLHHPVPGIVRWPLLATGIAGFVAFLSAEYIVELIQLGLAVP